MSFFQSMQNLMGENQAAMPGLSRILVPLNTVRQNPSV